MRIVRTEYQVENNIPVIYTFCREENGTRAIHRVTNFVPYFYCLYSEKDKLQGIRQDKEIYKSIFDEPLVKVYATLPEDVPKLRENYSKHFEADILFPLRWLIDNVDKLEPTNLKIFYLDIETDNHGRVPSVIKAEEPVVCVSLYCNDCYTTFVYREDLSPGLTSNIFNDVLHNIWYFRTEKDLLVKLVDFIRDEGPDVITGWNVIRFDLMYLLNRMENLGIRYSALSPMGSVYQREDKDVIIKGVAIVDLYDAYRKFNENMEESYQLDFIAKKVLGKGKTDSSNNVKYLWKYHLDKLIEYNCNDCLLVVEIDKKQGLLGFMDDLRRTAFCQLEDTLIATKIIDCYILKFLHNKKILPSKEHHERVTFEGAFVGSWATGIYSNVAVFDLRSLYPSIIVSLNLSPETLITEDASLWGDNIKVNDIYIKKDKKGFLPEVIESLFKERAKYKSLMRQESNGSDLWNVYNSRQKALKILLNAIYGQTAYPNSRIYSPSIASTVTWMGRKIINWSKDFVESLGYQALYCDTDSISVAMDNFDQVSLILNLLNDSYSDFAKQFGLDKHGFEMEFQKFYRRAFFGKDVKKRYAGHSVYSDGQVVDEINVLGFEIRRSDAAQFSRNLQQKVFDLLLRQDKTRDEILRYVGNEIGKMRAGKYKFSEIGIPKAMTKQPHEYGKLVDGVVKGVPAHVRGTFYSIKELGLELSNKPKMIYIAKMANGHPQTDVLCFDEDEQVPPGTELDVEKMLTRLVKAKLEGIFEALDWKMSELVYHWKRPKKKSGDQLALF